MYFDSWIIKGMFQIKRIHSTLSMGQYITDKFIAV